MLQVTDSNQTRTGESLAHLLLDFKGASPTQLKLNAQISFKQVKAGASLEAFHYPSPFLASASLKGGRKATPIPAAPQEWWLFVSEHFQTLKKKTTPFWISTRWILVLATGILGPGDRLCLLSPV